MSGYDGEIVDGKGECSLCGGWFTLRADGELRSHKCSGIIDVPAGDKPATAKTRSRTATGKRTKEIPDSVSKLVVALVASLAESVTRTAIARAVPMDRDSVPDQIVELPEPHDMIHPFLALAWPQVPAKAQHVAREIADHSDVIDAAFQWQEWLATMRAFTKAAREHRAQLEGTGRVVSFQPAATAAPGPAGGVAVTGLTPFQPASDASG